MPQDRMTADQLLDALTAVDALLLSVFLPADIRLAMASRVISHLLTMNDRDPGLFHISDSALTWLPPPLHKNL